MPYEDGLKFVYFNTQGDKGGSEEIRKMLRFIQESKSINVTDESTRELYDYVSRVKIQPEARLAYMRFDEIVERAVEKAVEENTEKVTQMVTKETMLNIVFELLKDYGEISERLRKRIESEKSVEILKKWHKIAAKSDSIEEFERKMEL